ncbi:proton-conducting transporter membrane subunit [Roseovarius autotrophicus]|uniref:proton-conducting transporter transmembrane domain-containing protein n=1 Tax=Roseovarius autotrophicus TaxID=2824121 RepID=UPI001B365C5B|nr:proton-conducting transporter membrane subunit [Roseovarius autotrophicus]
MDNVLIALMLLPPLLAAGLLAASLYAGDKWLSWRQVQAISFAATGVAAFAGLWLLVATISTPAVRTVTVMPWFEMGGQAVDLAFRLDPLSAVMAAMVTVFGFVICRFSINYMHNEIGFTRYFAAYVLFVAAMLVLVLADNLVLMFLGWEGVGLCSYLLIGHYTQRAAAGRAATEAFVANRVGDAGLILGILVLYAGAGTVRFSELPEAMAAADAWVAPAAAACLLVGALGKSAQVPLGGWLAKAMEGPTPSSALIHAATMVTAGVYLVVRAHPVFEAAPAVLVLAGLIGAVTALYGALGGQAATDIKGVLANSTSMHLGLMFVICGLGAYGVAVFYIVAHAFYKAYQFLTAPSILHHLHGKLDFETRTDPAPLPSGVGVALLVAVALVLTPPVLALAGAELTMGAALAVFAGAALLAVTLLGWMAISSVNDALADHAGGHDHAQEAQASTGLGSAGGAVITVLIAAAGAALLQLLPGGADGSWFHAFLGLPQGAALGGAPGLTVLLALMLAVLAAHSVLSTLLLSRAAPEAALGSHPLLRTLYAAASNRLWIDAVIQARILPFVFDLSERLARLDLRLSRGTLGGAANGAARAGDAVAWLDTVPRRAAEALPGAMGLHLAEATRHVETQATTGFEATVDRAATRLGHAAILVERALGRPVVSIGLIILVALAALAGA